LPAQHDSHLGFSWGPCFKIDKAFPRTEETAQLVASELERIAGSGGMLTADDVVTAAKPETAPLHNAFTWDNIEAAENWRRDQARELMHGVKVVVVTTRQDGSEEQSEPVPVYASFKPEGEQRAYRNVVVSARNKSHSDAMLAEAMVALAGVRKRYAGLSQLAGVFREIDRVLAKENLEELAA
jgi:hypothetical protein